MVVTSPTDGSRGTTTIAESVVAKIAALATREVDGVTDLGGAILSGAISGVVSRIRGEEHRTGGVGVEVGTRQAAVDLSVCVRYPAPVREVTDLVRTTVMNRITSLTGLDVVEVNIVVTDLSFGDPTDRSGGAMSGTRVA